MTDMNMRRKQTRQVKVKDVKIGGDAPIVVQSMTCTKTDDIVATLEQIERLTAAGCELVRVAIPDQEAVKALPGLVKASPIPVIADIHFDHRLAIGAIEAGAAKIRINPGNIGTESEVQAIVARAKEAGIPIRIGVNSGSLPAVPGPESLSVSDRLVKSAVGFIEVFESQGFSDIVLSVKASEVRETIDAYRRLSQATDHPLHLGVTEAGSFTRATIKSAVAFAILLEEGIGDTLRVSITGDPVDEVMVGYHILSALGIRQHGPEIVSCPTCGRCEIDLAGIADQIEEIVSTIDIPLHIAVMGCVVNGPGEAKAADIGIAGGRGRGSIFVDGLIVATVPESELITEFRRQLEKIIEARGGSSKE